VLLTTIITANQELLPPSNNLLLLQRGFNYGDGLFETMYLAKGQIVFATAHCNRLRAGLNTLHINAPFELNADNLMHQCARLLEESHSNPDLIYRVKLIILRAPGGLYAPTSNEGLAILQMESAAVYPSMAVVSAGISNNVKLSLNPLSAYKSISAWPYILAGLEKTTNQWAEILICSSDGYVAEAGAANLFWYKDEVLYTPHLSTGCIAGVVRAELIQYAQNVGVKINETKMRLTDLHGAEWILCTNSSGLKFIDKLVYANGIEVHFPVIHIDGAPEWLNHFWQTMFI
jgi:branched-subunit amino acid aminotransferase/4-amino-4-deoxychorismate lyase